MVMENELECEIIKSTENVFWVHAICLTTFTLKFILLDQGIKRDSLIPKFSKCYTLFDMLSSLKIQ